MKRDKTKSPWRWLITGDKGIFMIGWLIFTGVATWVSWEYGWKIIVPTDIFCLTVFGVLWAYRFGKYTQAVKDRDILSFRVWRRTK